jgi:hypothetical protein
MVLAQDEWLCFWRDINGSPFWREVSRFCSREMNGLSFWGETIGFRPGTKRIALYQGTASAVP